ncbi:hypothetical protein RND81_11G175700 [Saponaria officinalis]|uniref:CCR4-NOT transcription complex subunit 4 n=1 Tax=Saponaria officinalis TaxID=3572 RepID=A0AAW1HNW9_SAPOF
MSDEGEKTCPLCAEEMDMTDQQLKPCRCGYEVCVWCWHHIMEMAEKDDTEGRCPACRTPYDKERIVATAASCERLVAEVNMEKKHKTQKAKPKTTDSRKQLTSVRVIQRNLVYIVGLPLNLADEDLLQRKEYFGQYGKVLKVSISRTSAGTIQQFPNNTCSVYITYAREDEAVRCIQSVHAFILDGRPLRACFGTTKYCHAWLRNVPCSNPDCLYLHEIGSEEDSFTKDEIISAYSRVQEITGITNNMQRRSGNVLPPPADDYCNNTPAVTGKPGVKNASNSSVSSTRGSPPSSSSGRSGALPSAASWGARASNCNPAAGSLATSNGPTKQKAETVHGQPPVIGSVVSDNTSQTHSLPNDIAKSHDAEEACARHTKSKMEGIDPAKQCVGLNSHSSVSETSSTASAVPAVKSTSQLPCSLEADGHEGEGSKVHKARYSIDKRPCSPLKHEGESSTADVNIQKLPEEVSSMSSDKQPNGDYSEVLRPNGLSLDSFISHRDQGFLLHESEKRQEHSGTAGKAAEATYSLTDTRELYNLKSDVQTPCTVQNLTSETEDDFDNQRLRDAIVSQAPMPASSPLHIFNHFRAPSQPQFDAGSTGSYTLNPQNVNRLSDESLGLNLPGASFSSNGFLEHLVNHASAPGNPLLNGMQGNHLGHFDGEVAHVDPSESALDMRESNIISNILSLDLDSWDDSLTSPQNLAKLLADKQECSIKSGNSWKSQTSNQSRFSFARQDDSRNYMFEIEPTLGNIDHTAKSPFYDQRFVENRDPYLNRLGNGFGIPNRNVELSDNLFGGPSAFPSSKFSVSRSQISAPPGFSVPSRPPPPGFSSQERSDQSFDFLNSGNQLHETSSFLRNSYQASSNGNMSTANDIEFIDPAILAVGKGRLPSGAYSSGIDMWPNFQGQAFEDESRLQFLMQRSLSPQQNLRYTDARDNILPSNEPFGFNYRHMEQPLATNVSPFSQYSLQQPRNTVVSNGHRDGWSEVQSPNDMGIADLLRNDRVGLNKFYGGYEDSKFRMTNSGDIYNRNFGM